MFFSSQNFLSLFICKAAINHQCSLPILVQALLSIVNDITQAQQIWQACAYIIQTQVNTKSTLHDEKVICRVKWREFNPG